MVTRLDRDVGRIAAKLDELGIARDTLILFTSDNGPTFERVGGADSGFFASTGGLRGRKGSVYEGGLRVPLLARWPGRIAPGRTTAEPVAAWDFLPTVLALADRHGARADRAIAPSAELDGVDLSPLLFGELFGAKRHLYWELASYGGQQAARFGDWKALRRDLRKESAKIELYDLARDPNETRDVAGEHPELVEHARELFGSSRTDSTHFPLGR
jgi:arylsulfatase A